MKRTFLFVVLSVLLLFSGLDIVCAQQEPKPRKDTVNIDTDAKPQFYYAIEDEETGTSSGKGNATILIMIVVGGVLVAAGVGFFLLKKKK